MKKKEKLKKNELFKIGLEICGRVQPLITAIGRSLIHFLLMPAA